MDFYSETILAGLRNTIGTSFTDGATTVTLKYRLEGDPLVYFSEGDQSPPTPLVVIEPEDGAFPEQSYDERPQFAVQRYRGTVHYVEDVPANLTTVAIYPQVRRRAEILTRRVAAAANLGIAEPLGTTVGDMADFIQYTFVESVHSRELNGFFKEAGQNKLARGFRFFAEIWTSKVKTST